MLTSIQIEIIEILAERFAIDESEIQLKSHIKNDLGADSLDLVELVMALEERFSIHVPEGDIGKIAMVGDLTAYVERRLRSC